MSISASYLVLAVLILRPLLKKAPRWISVLLWGIVALRLVCPFSIESVMSLIPNAQTVSPDIMTDNTPSVNTGIPIVNNTLNPIIGESFAPNPGDSVNPLQVWIPILASIWVLGMLALAVYAVVSYLKVKRSIGTAVLYEGNIYQSESVVSPFVLGLIKPKIYIPFNMNETDLPHVIAHERGHISRRDHIWKPIGFLLLTVYWFNPLMWLGYILLCRDIELACDERVVKGLDREARADYSQALLACSVNRRMIAACPIAFGEVGVKDRVKSVLNYKKPAFWIIIVAIVACVVVAVCFLTNPKNKDNSSDDVGADTPGTEETKKYGETDPEKLTPEQLSVMENCSQYFGLEFSNGLDVYVWQMAKGSYSFALFSHNDDLHTGDTFIASLETLLEKDLVLTTGLTVEAMRVVLSTYDVTAEQIHIVLGSCVYSSYIPEWFEHIEGEDIEEKRRIYTEYIWNMLFGNPTDDGGEGSDEISLIFHAPAYDWVTSYVPRVKMKGDKIYDADTEELLGSFATRTMNCFSALSQLKDYSADEAALADKLWIENRAFYEVTPATLKSDNGCVDLYYVMTQTDGRTLLVYGHYENGEKTGLIRWIFDLGKYSPW